VAHLDRAKPAEVEAIDVDCTHAAGGLQIVANAEDNSALGIGTAVAAVHVAVMVVEKCTDVVACSRLFVGW